MTLRLTPPVPAVGSGALRAGLYEFVHDQKIDSKEEGVTQFRPYMAQRMLFDAVCEGNATGVHTFWVVKARQVGLSTAAILLTLYWIMVHKRLRGAMVTDTDDNREIFRDAITMLIDGLGEKWTDTVKRHNRNRLELASGGLLQYLVAGVRKNDRLGRARAINFLHATEVAYWGSPEAMRALKSALAEMHPHRLYLYESTACGLNFFHDLIKAAHRDPSQRVIFAGFWACEAYNLERTDPRFAEYWRGGFTEEEVERAIEVKKHYGITITPEQVAWHRWKLDVDMMGDDRAMRQEYPWTEDEAFVESGDMFFPSRPLIEIGEAIEASGVPANAYHYTFGTTYLDTRLHACEELDDATLLVWEQPEGEGCYVIGIDPAYGRGEDSDSHVISVWRCYADRIVQAAEYATNAPSAKELAWVLAHLSGAYRDNIANLEVTGPGAVVMRELQDLKEQLFAEFAQPGRPDGDIEAVAPTMRWYLYHRVDTMGSGYVWNWSTTQDTKQQIMIQLRDAILTRSIEVRSAALLEEMQRLVQIGPRIMADAGFHDDHVMAAALALRTWIEWRRNELTLQGKTWAASVKAAEKPTISMLTSAIIEDHFARARSEKLLAHTEF